LYVVRKGGVNSGKEEELGSFSKQFIRFSWSDKKTQKAAVLKKKKKRRDWAEKRRREGRGLMVNVGSLSFRSLLGEDHIKGPLIPGSLLLRKERVPIRRKGSRSSQKKDNILQNQELGKKEADLLRGHVGEGVHFKKTASELVRRLTQSKKSSI